MSRTRLCAKCRYPWTRVGLVPYDATCDKCESYLHTCRNCGKFDALALSGCKDKNGDPGPTPDSKNFCDAFAFRESIAGAINEAKLDRYSAEEKWKNLFKE